MNIKIFRGKPPELPQTDEFLLLSVVHMRAKYGEPGPKVLCEGMPEDLMFRNFIDYKGATNYPVNGYGDSRIGEKW